MHRLMRRREQRHGRAGWDRAQRGREIALHITRPPALDSLHDDHPPPHAQCANKGYVIAPKTTEDTQNATYFHRSATAPVTMVNAVSMKTIWNRNSTMTPTS